MSATSLPTTLTAPPGITLSAPAEAPNVALVRQVLSGLLDSEDVDPALSADVKIAVTEACTNVVVHAYPDSEGPLDTTMTVVPGRLIVSVRDRGLDFKPLPGDAGTPALGFGLALIASLSDEFSIHSGSSGTEVQMMFSLGEEPSPEAARLFAESSQLANDSGSDQSGIALSLAPGAPLVSVLGRVVSLLAARADFSIDRLSDAQLVSDALATHAPRRTANGFLRVAVTEDDQGFDLRIGPLERDGGQALVSDTALPGVGSLLERLSNGLSFEPVSGSLPGAETLKLRLSRSTS